MSAIGGASKIFVGSSDDRFADEDGLFTPRAGLSLAMAERPRASGIFDEILGKRFVAISAKSW
ncbi:hypothetical protein [Bradyrhizobium elkanii]|uniref:hypothetical protein n=1 Tax=Bradyrhizobium elkanii TaxID=29448 RepID=UPI001BA7D9EE|nr:hypothetical protein [Bradyrhizobium elkanii]MBR1163837.1 hypothetical protein [Bradyrhizobium elkanii]